jgi:peptidoglycan hydrolase CwlO-like protein
MRELKEQKQNLEISKNKSSWTQKELLAHQKEFFNMVHNINQ